MDQNQTQTNPGVDNDLQKAIDDITNTTNVDPVFSDPVAAPSSVPEGDTGELGEPIGPFPEATATVATVEKGPEPIAPLESMNIPEFNTPPVPPLPETPTPEVPTPTVPAPETPAPTAEATPGPAATEKAPEPTPGFPAETTPEPLPQNVSTTELKKAALRDLAPLLEKVDMDSSEKFKIYRDIFEDLKDHTILEPAYQTAREIADENERAKALLYLINSIDKM